MLLAGRCASAVPARATSLGPGARSPSRPSRPRCPPRMGEQLGSSSWPWAVSCHAARSVSTSRARRLASAALAAGLAAALVRSSLLLLLLLLLLGPSRSCCSCRCLCCVSWRSLLLLLLLLLLLYQLDPPRCCSAVVARLSRPRPVRRSLLCEHSSDAERFTGPCALFRCC